MTCKNGMLWKQGRLVRESRRNVKIKWGSKQNLRLGVRMEQCMSTWPSEHWPSIDHQLQTITESNKQTL